MSLDSLDDFRGSAYAVRELFRQSAEEIAEKDAARQAVSDARLVRFKQRLAEDKQRQQYRGGNQE